MNSIRVQAFRGRDGFWLLMMSSMLFLLLLPISTYVAALSFIKTEWMLTNTEAGILFSSLLIGYAVSALFVIPLTDRFGAKMIFMISSLASIVIHVMFATLADNIIFGVSLRILAGTCFAGTYIPGLRIISERFTGSARGAAIGMFVTAQYGANSASIAFTGILLSSFDWREAYLFIILVSSLSVPMAFFLLLGHESQFSKMSSGRLDLSVLKNRRVRYYIAGYSIHAWQIHSVRTWLPGFLLAVLVSGGFEGNEAVSKAAVASGLAMTIGSLGPIMGGSLSDKYGRTITLIAITTLSGILGWSIGWMNGMPWALIIFACAVYGWSVSADSGIYTAGITDSTSSGNLGSAMALQAFFALLVGSVGPVAFGGILDVSTGEHGWRLAFSTLGILSLITIIGLYRLRSYTQYSSMSNPLNEGS